MSIDIPSSLLPGNQTKKKKKYILHLFDSRQSNKSTIETVERAVFSSSFTYIRVEDPDEALKVLVLKNVEIIFLDETFLNDIDLTMDFSLEVKKRRKTPLVFVVTDERELIEIYRRKMFLFGEMDDYITSPPDFQELRRKIKMMGTVEGRASKRFEAKKNVGVSKLNDSEMYPAILLDLSTVGIGLKLSPKLTMSRGEQLRIRIHITRDFQLFDPQFGEFFYLSVKVRRVSIHGRVIGCSLEYLTESQKAMLISLLTKLYKAQQESNKDKKKKPSLLLA